MRSHAVHRILAAISTSLALASLAGCPSSPDTPSDAAVAPDASPSLSPRFTAGPCALDEPGLPPASERRCGTIEVAQLRRAARPVEGAEPTIELHVEVLAPARSGAPTVFLTGGPGFSLVHYRVFGVLPQVLAASPGPVLLLEQRGNLLSSSGLECEGAPDAASCAAALRARGIVPEAFNSLESAEDVADALTALELAPAFVWGHSYGSALAQRFALAHPELVRGLVLEGVSDPTRDFASQGIDMLAHRIAVLERFAAWHATRCMRDAACTAAHPSGLDPEGDLQYLVSRFMEREDLVLELPAGRTLDLPTAIAIVDTHLAYHDGLLLVLELFDAVVARERDGDASAALDALVARLGDGDAALGASRLDVLLGPDPRGSAISGLAKTCFDYRSIPDCGPFDASLYPAALTDAIADAQLDVPTLYLQGELDTQSPVQTAERLRARFPQRSEAILGTCVGHFVLRDASECARLALAAFFAGDPQPDADALTGCEVRACNALPILSGTRALPGE